MRAFYATDFLIGDRVYVVDTIVLPNGSFVLWRTLANVVLVQDNRVDFVVVSTVDGSLPVGAGFSLFDALGGKVIDHNQSIASVELVFRKDDSGSGLDFEIKGDIYPSRPLDGFKTVKRRPIIWESEDCGGEALAAYGAYLRGDK